jgi:alkylated DNA nucleotide flippase Atl1
MKLNYTQIIITIFLLSGIWLYLSQNSDKEQFAIELANYQNDLKINSIIMKELQDSVHRSTERAFNEQQRANVLKADLNALKRNERALREELALLTDTGQIILKQSEIIEEQDTIINKQDSVIITTEAQLQECYSIVTYQKSMLDIKDSTLTKQTELLEICRKNVQPPNWLERNKFGIGVGTGIVISILLSIII